MQEILDRYKTGILVSKGASEASLGTEMGDQMFASGRAMRLVAGLLIGPVLGGLGTLVVVKRFAFFSEAVGHAGERAELHAAGGQRHEAGAEDFHFAGVGV